MMALFSKRLEKVSVTQTKWQIRAEKEPEYNELMWLRWYYGHIQAYVNQIPFEHEDYDTFQEWIVDYYEHPDWGSNYKLKVPEKYRRGAINKTHAKDGRGCNWEWPEHWNYPLLENDKITEGDK